MDDDEGEDLDLKYKKDNWREGNWDRKWECDHFKTEFRHGQCFVKTDSDDLHPLVSLCYGFIIGYYYHPQNIGRGMASKAQQEAHRVCTSQW
mmetsp:Transcript_3177/g.6427  ORF Transcript_3177/g.6427 Transcript_3177/m.6427 type:complete len:92 (-) Transcript_3177:145-420(-)|eukprot:CAMPEP_0116914572 /NCGR_PEP_ID=MMETSP0467-20121206/17408_1 /TAXON_ID=283647 /ORGANISM="Mesodinium pulex, Strain SPMC105" /LENGTH=91 /DNA_ID=CAMNT_0004591061 /DNA_START=591 /DNA_END=866 /DNA_ORIENTATION=+